MSNRIVALEGIRGLPADDGLPFAPNAIEGFNIELQVSYGASKVVIRNNIRLTYFHTIHKLLALTGMVTRKLSPTLIFGIISSTPLKDTDHKKRMERVKQAPVDKATETVR
jgi:hypothetical protein